MVKENNTRFNAKTKDEIVGNIYRTYDYKQFKLNKVNRAISKTHVKEIEKALKIKKAKLPVIQVNPKMEIIDGQHRFTALMHLRLPIYYYVDRQSDEESIIQINSKQNRWHLPQFVHARAEQNLPGYKELENYMSEYKGLLAPSGVVAIFSGNKEWSGGNMTKIVQAGDFEFGNKEAATRFLNKVANAKKKLTKKQELSNSLIKGLWAYDCLAISNEDRLISLINDDFVKTVPRDKNSLMVFIGREYNKNLKTGKIKFSIDYRGKFRFEEE